MLVIHVAVEPLSLKARSLNTETAHSYDAWSLSDSSEYEAHRRRPRRKNIYMNDIKPVAATYHYAPRVDAFHV